MKKFILFFFCLTSYIYLVSSDDSRGRATFKVQSSLTDTVDIVSQRGSRFPSEDELEHSAEPAERVGRVRFLFSTVDGVVIRRPGSPRGSRLDRAVQAWVDAEEQGEGAVVAVDPFRDRRACHDRGGAIDRSDSTDQARCCSPCSYLSGLVSGVAGSVLLFVVFHTSEVLNCASK